MSVRPSTSTQFADLNATFQSDCSALEQSIRRLKEKAAKDPQNSGNDSVSYPKSTSDHDSRLANRAKDLRNMTEQVNL